MSAARTWQTMQPRRASSARGPERAKPKGAMEASMYRIACLLVVGFIAGASLISMTRSAAAEANCPQGATCKCVPTTFEKCKVDAQGRQYDCQTFKGEKCTVVSGPGSGKPAALTHALEATVAEPGAGGVPPSGQGAVAQPVSGTGAVAQPDTGTVTPTDKGKAVRSKVAPSTAR